MILPLLSRAARYGKHVSVNEPFVVWTFVTGIAGTALAFAGYSRHAHLRTPPPASLVRHDPELVAAGAVKPRERQLRLGTYLEWNK